MPGLAEPLLTGLEFHLIPDLRIKELELLSTFLQRRLCVVRLADETGAPKKNVIGPGNSLR